MPEEVFERLVQMFSANQAAFRVVEHTPIGTSEEVAATRGTQLSQGAKAMVCRVKLTSSQRCYVLAVFPADGRADLDKVAVAVGGKKASLATPEEAESLTGCVMGAVPPVSFHDDLRLIIDPTLATRHEEIAFNAGRLDRSIIINTRDYLHAVQPQRADLLRAENV